MNPAFWEHPYVKGLLIPILIASVYALWRALRAVPKKGRQKVEILLQDIIFKANEPIRKELMGEDGSSLRDIVNRIEIALSEDKESILAERVRKWALFGMNDENIAIFETDANGALTDISGQVTQWTGCPIAELRGDRWIRIIAPREQEDVENWWRTVVKRGTAGEMEQTYIGHDRKPFKVRVSAIPLIDPRTGVLMGHTGKITKLNVDVIE